MYNFLQKRQQFLFLSLLLSDEFSMCKSLSSSIPAAGTSTDLLISRDVFDLLGNSLHSSSVSVSLSSQDSEQDSFDG